MRARCTQHELVEMLQTVIDAVPQRPPMPVLASARIEAAGGVVSISATDLEISITARREMDVDGDGAGTFPARNVYDVVRELGDVPLELVTEDDHFRLSSEFGQYNLLSAPADDFPRQPEGIDGLSFEIDGKTLRRMVSRVVFAVLPDETRPALSGISWRVMDGRTVMVATDGYRLARVAETLDATIDEPIEIIVPPRVLSQAVKIMRAGGELKQVTIGKRRVHFAYENADLFAQLIEGEYVNADAVIPKNNDRIMEVPIEALKPAVRRVTVMASQQNHQIKMAVTDGLVELSTVNREAGTRAREALEVDYYGEAIDVGYNAEYLLEVLGRVDTDMVRFKFREPTTAAIVEPAEQAEGEECVFLLMPLRLIEG